MKWQQLTRGCCDEKAESACLWDSRGTNKDWGQNKRQKKASETGNLTRHGQWACVWAWWGIQANPTCHQPVVEKKWPHYLVSGSGVCYRLLQTWCLSSDFPLVQLSACSTIDSNFSSLEFYTSVVSRSTETQNLERPAICIWFSENQQDLWWDKQPAFSACSFSLLPSFSPAHTWLTTSNPQTTNVRKNPKKVNFETDVIKDFRQPEYGGNWSLNRNNVCFF